jgi:phosphoglycolate phosphatase
MDGTILDSLEDIKTAMNHALKENNLPIHESLDKFREFTGDGQLTFVKRSIGEPLNKDEDLVNKVQKDYADYYHAHYDVYSKPYDGIIDLLNYLQDKGCKIAVLTNKPTPLARKIADNVFKGIKFEYVLGPSEEHPKKPNPSALLMMLDEFAVKPDECLYFGDTNTDMQTANNANVIAVGVTWGFRTREELVVNGAKHIITHPSQAIKLFESY